MRTLYHVASDRYQAGEDLVCWDTLLERGLVTAADWKWDDAEVGTDGDVVCLFDTEADARAMQELYGGQVLRVDLPDELPLTVVEEGFYAAHGRISAAYITTLG